MKVCNTLAIIVAVFLTVPYIKGEYFTKKKSILPDNIAGGEANA